MLFDNIRLVFSLVINVFIMVLILVLQNYRMRWNTEYAKSATSVRGARKRLDITGFMKVFSLCILITSSKALFVSLYILTPMLIALHLALYNTGWIWGFMTIVKGLYYLGLATISAFQFYFNDEGIIAHALGFTLSLALFEAITALSDGIRKIREATRNG